LLQDDKDDARNTSPEHIRAREILNYSTEVKKMNTEKFTRTQNLIALN